MTNDQGSMTSEIPTFKVLWNPTGESFAEE
jgi:hypothetical protein